jgi:hypothetical protein
VLPAKALIGCDKKQKSQPGLECSTGPGKVPAQDAAFRVTVRNDKKKVSRTGTYV